MSNTTSNFTVNVSLPVVPEVNDEELFTEALKIYNAIRSLAIGLDDYTDSGELKIEIALIGAEIVGAVAPVIASVERIEYDIITNNLQSQIINLTEQLQELKLQIDTLKYLTHIPWESPEAIGSDIPADITGVEILGKNITALEKFGCNGKAAQVAYLKTMAKNNGIGA